MEGRNNGIWRYGKLKRKLLFGIAGPIFEHFLLTKQDKFHLGFLDAIFPIRGRLDVKRLDHQYISLFIYDLPCVFFEDFFLKDKYGKIICPVLNVADAPMPDEAAYLTQAFVMFNLEQVLKNKPEYIEKFGFSIPQLENLIDEILGRGHQILIYLNILRESINTEKLESHFIEWPGIYLDMLCALQFSSEEKIYENANFFNDVLTRNIYCAAASEFMVNRFRSVREYVDNNSFTP